MPEYTDILGNAQEAMGVFMAEDRTYLDMSGKLREADGVFITDTLLYDDLSGNAREAQGVFVVGGGGGGGLLPTQAIIDDGQQITATNGQTILVAVADNVPSLTALPYPMWQPFTVTCGSDGFGGFGYSAVEGEEMGSISNEPVDGYYVETCSVDGDGNFYFYLRGPKPMSDILWGADIGIDTVSYVFGPFNGHTAPWSNLANDGDVVSRAEFFGVTPWTDGQIVPIVIIPQNGG